MLGLAKQVTTFSDTMEVRSQAVSTGGVSISDRLSDINRKRRIRRMRRVVIASANASQTYLAQHGRRSHVAFATLTYRPGVAWAPEHISEYLKACKLYAKRNGFEFRYQWVLELQQRGAPHYHVLFWLPHDRKMPKPDKGAWLHGRSNIKRATSPVGYVVKYATKGELGVFAIPKGARLFGTGGGTDWERCISHRAGLPMWLDSLVPPRCRATRVSRVGWVCRETGEVFNSPYIVTWFKDDWGIVVVKVTEIGVLHGVTSADRGWDGYEADHQWERGERELPSVIADRDFASWAIRLSDEYQAWA